MSEAEKILTEYTRGYHDEFEASGRIPTVCIAGRFSYDALHGALMAYFGDLIKMWSENENRFTYHGVSIYKSHKLLEGFWFGSKERE